MLEAIYVVVAVLIFFAQVRNGLITAALTALFWPIVIVALTVFTIVTTAYHVMKK